MLRNALFGITCVMAASLAANTFADDDGPPGSMVVKLRDMCDPVTFNAVAGPGTCVGDFHVTFQQFITELNQDQTVGAWRFHPLKFEARQGTQLILQNLGGETHTFTEVKHFGGGFVAALNGPSGTPTPAPECAQVAADGTLTPQPPSPTNQFVLAGASVQGPVLTRERTIKYQCCIHPWMRATVRVDD
jgi:hypothetical protein